MNVIKYVTTTAIKYIPRSLYAFLWEIAFEMLPISFIIWIHAKFHINFIYIWMSREFRDIIQHWIALTLKVRGPN